MTEQIDQIIPLLGGSYFNLQSLYNDVDEAGEPVAGSYYVGYPCVGEDDATPLPGHQHGEVYLAAGIASLESAPGNITI